MTLDQILSKMLDSLEASNFWDSEAYAQMALDYVEANKPLGKIDKEELLFHVNGVLKRAKEKNDFDRKKENLIESIVNFRI